MAIKFTMLGYLIYLAMACYLAAAVLLASKRKGLGHGVYFLGFALMIAAFVVRWHEAEHAPMQNLFEVFICLGLVIYPISLFCRRFLRVGGEAADAGILGVLVLFPAGFVFSADPEKLPPALQSPLFIPHVSAYMFSYIILAKAAVQAIALLAGRRQNNPALVSYEQGSYRMVMLGFPLLTIGLVLGAWWAELGWGDFWGWDPKELWSLVSWLVFIVYFHVRHMFGAKYPRLNAALVAAGLLAILITLILANLSRIFAGMHSYAS